MWIRRAARGTRRARTAPPGASCSSGSPTRALAGGPEGGGRGGPARAAAGRAGPRRRATRPRNSRSGPAFRRPRCCGSGGCSGCRSRPRGTTFTARRRSRPRSRSACSSSLASARTRSLEITRVLGEGMSRLAAATAAAFVEAFLQPGDSEHEVARAIRRDGRAADPRDRSGAPGGATGASRRERPAGDARARRASDRPGRRDPGGHGVLRRHGRVHASRRPRSRPRSSEPWRASSPSSLPT